MHKKQTVSYDPRKKRVDGKTDHEGTAELGERERKRECMEKQNSAGEQSIRTTRLLCMLLFLAH